MTYGYNHTMQMVQRVNQAEALMVNRPLVNITFTQKTTNRSMQHK